jgi:hypothetical protein
MRPSITLIAATLLLPQVAVHAQEKKESAGRPSYRVEFNIRDSSDAAAKSRHYMLLMQEGRKTVFKIGTRVPVATTESFLPSTGGSAVNAMAATQYQYVDVGVNIECLVSEMNGKIAVQGNLNLTNVMQRDSAAREARLSNPTLAQTKLDLDAAIDPGKPTVIAAFDDPAGTRQFQVETTVTRAN